MIDHFLLEGLESFFNEEFDEYSLAEAKKKILHDPDFLKRLQAELLDILDNLEEQELDDGF